ncbi:MAG: L,D-transpeptidase [Myxococcota bacterium]
MSGRRSVIAAGAMVATLFVDPVRVASLVQHGERWLAPAADTVPVGLTYDPAHALSVSTRPLASAEDPAAAASHATHEAAGDAPAEANPGRSTQTPHALVPAPAAQSTEAKKTDGDAQVPPPPGPVLVSVASETWVYAEPRWKSRKLGYLRAGATVGRAEAPVHRRGCRQGWYPIEPEGFVCHNRLASLDPGGPVAQLSARRPFMGGLPYTYVTSRYPTPPLYARLPSDAEQRQVEPKLERHLRRHRALASKPGFTAFPAPEPLSDQLQAGEVLPGLGGQLRGPNRLTLGHARVRSGFALLGTYDHGGRRFGLTTELALLPLDRTRVVAPSALSGVRLSDEFNLPLAIVRSKHARRYLTDAAGGPLRADAPLGWRSAVALTGRTLRRGEARFLEARDGSFVRADQVVHLRKFNRAPKWARQGKKWIDLSLLRQALVAYEGTEPVYATIVSTGAGGIGDPEETHATVQGAYLIHTKHVSVTMDGDEAGDEFDLRDVPFVQYFHEGYALHGAYWHDDFGRPRSHGCVNLAPRDAAWLFGWTTPGVPEGWHAALSLRRGTVVYIHP